NCNTGTWTGSPSFTFTWKQDGSTIANQTAQSYTLAAGDVGHTIKCSVTGHNAGGDTGPVDSNGMAVTLAAPANTVPPSIPAGGQTGDQITCNPGTWTGSPSFPYSWTRDGSPIAGQAGQMYTLTDTDATHLIRCVVTGHNGGGDSAPVISNALSATVAPPANSV